MNGKLILAVLLALLLVGAAVTIVNAKDPDADPKSGLAAGPLDSGVPRDRDADDGPATPAALPVPPEPAAPLTQPTPVNHTSEHDENETDEEEDEDEDDRGSGDDGHGPEGGGLPCHCPDSRPQSDADAELQKDVEFQDSEELHADRVRFILTVTNVGSDTLFNVGVVDDLPDLGSDWHAGGPDGNDCTIDEHLRAVCNFGDMEPGAERVVVFSTFNCEFACGDDIRNTARVFADNDGNAENDLDDAVIPRPPCPADVAVRKNGEVLLGESSDPGARDDSVIFVIDVKNFGEGTAGNVTLRDELPRLHGAGWTVGGPDGDDCAITQGVLTCPFGDLGPGEMKQITVESDLCHVACDDQVNNTATVTAENDDNVENNSDSISLTAPDCPDAELVKEASVTDNEDHPELDRVVYRFTVTNVGTQAVTGVVLTDDLYDFGVEWQLSGRDAFDCTIDESNELRCDFGDLRPGEVKTVTVTADACDIGCGEDIVNTARIESDNDLNPNNDEDQAVVERDPCGSPEGEPEDQDTGNEEETS